LGKKGGSASIWFTAFSAAMARERAASNPTRWFWRRRKRRRRREKEAKAFSTILRQSGYKEPEDSEGGKATILRTNSSVYFRKSERRKKKKKKEVRENGIPILFILVRKNV